MNSTAAIHDTTSAIVTTWNSERVYSPVARRRGRDRQEARRRHQRAGQHRERGRLPREARRLQPREALLHLDRHHLDRDDRVVDQQAQRQHQRAERNLVQADAEVMHHREGHRQHQRDRDRDDEAGAETQREETHQQHDRHRLGEHAQELADRLAHRARLVADLAQLHAGRQRLLQARELVVQRVAEPEDVAAVLHRDGDADRVLAHEAHLRRGRDR